MKGKVAFIGASIGNSGRVSGGQEAGSFLEKKFPFHSPFFWQKTIKRKGDSQGREALKDIAEFSLQLARETKRVCKEGNFPFILGGDHTCAIGTWSGIASLKKIGILWIDAHLDGHTLESSHTGNIHGMPLASLLGAGDSSLTEILTSSPKLKPENVSIIGARDYEPEEKALFDSLGVRIYEMPEIQEKGISFILQEAVERAKKETEGYGISFDLDSLNPSFAPAVGTPVKNGLCLQETLKALSCLDISKLAGFEISEFNPLLFENEKCEEIIWSIVRTLFPDAS